MPASVGIANFIGEVGTPIQTVMAVAVLFALPACPHLLCITRCAKTRRHCLA
jgi:multiple sugar transport system permease protein